MALTIVWACRCPRLDRVSSGAIEAIERDVVARMARKLDLDLRQVLRARAAHRPTAAIDA